MSGQVMWEGRPLAVSDRPGQSLAAALWAAGVRDLAAPGEPRGLSCGVGHCYGCRVVVDGVHGVRACLVAVRDGLRACREPGSADAPESPQAPPQIAGGGSQTCQVAVVGAGPAGLAAAAELARLGAPVTVLDEAPAPGGRLTGTAAGQRLVGEALAAGARIVSGAAVWALSPGWLLHAAPVDGASAGVPAEVAAKRVVLATGAAQLPLALPGWTLPGVLAPWAALHLLDRGALPPGARAVVVGTDPVTLAAARRLQSAGVTVAAVVAPEPSPWVLPAPQADPELAGGLPMAADRRAVAFRGTGRLEAVELRAPGSAELTTVAAELAVAGAGLAPLTEALRLVGGAVAHVPELGGDAALHGPSLETSLGGLFVAGGITGIEGEAVAEAQGRLAAVACGVSLGLLKEARAAAAREEAAAAVAQAARDAARWHPLAAAGRAKIMRQWEREMGVSRVEPAPEPPR